MKEALYVICAAASRTLAVSLLHRMKAAQAVICGGWRRLLGNLERVAADAFIQLRCLMLDRSGQNAWLQGEVHVDSLRQALEFTCRSSAADNRRGRISVSLADSARLSFKCMCIKAKNTAGSFYDVTIDLDNSSLIFRCESLLDAASLQTCLLSYLLFRAMLTHQNPPSFYPSRPGTYYTKLRLKLMRSIRLFRAFKASIAQTPPTASPWTLLHAQALAAQGSQSFNRKFDEQAAYLVSHHHAPRHAFCVTRCRWRPFERRGGMPAIETGVATCVSNNFQICEN
jgi:hypothetical protein